MVYSDNNQERFLGELPLLRIENLFFAKEHFIDVVLKIIFEKSQTLEETTNLGVISLLKELNLITVTR